MIARGREALGVELSEGILTVTINRPERRNAVDYETLDALGDVLLKDATAPEVRAVVLTGAGDAFCAGADLAAAAEGPYHTPEDTMDTANRVIRAIVDLEVPVIAHVTGPAVGFGVSMALVADISVAVEEAYFVFGFTPNGLMPDGGATFTVPSLVGRARAGALLLLGERVTAQEAAAAGLLTAALPAQAANTYAGEVARRLAKGARRAQLATKRAITAPLREQLEATLSLEKQGQSELLAGPEFAEAITARFQKRPPVFPE